MMKNSAETETEFCLKLDLIEAILVNKFPKLTILGDTENAQSQRS